MDRINEAFKKGSFLLVLKEDNYNDVLCKLIKYASKKNSKICLTSLNKSYADFMQELKCHDVNTDSFFFVDTLSSHYLPQDNKENCLFIQDPMDFVNIQESIKFAVDKKKCNIIILDTITDMMNHGTKFSISQFTNNLMSFQDVNKVLIVLKGGLLPDEEIDCLVEDLKLFTHESVDFLD